jgi:transposase InsO family protein
MGPNHLWACDFVFDACANGQNLKCLTITDEFTRESLAIDVAGSIRSVRVIEVLARLISEHGAPRHLRSDNGRNSSAKRFSSVACPMSFGHARASTVHDRLFSDY